MTPERWLQIREVFGAALETPQSERLQFLESACGHDKELRIEVERLLAGNEEPSWESPASTLLALGAEFTSGDLVGQYRIDARLGEGGMGVVYKAYDTRLHRNVALKVLSHGQLDDSEHKRRIVREARAASALNHPNIVTVYEIGSEGDVHFIAMEYVAGQSLAQAISTEGLALGPALAFAIEITDALAKAHSAGVIHRDLKSANIMLTSEGHIKLLDFGLAWRNPMAKPGNTLIAEGEIAGTVGYMSPEQIRGLPVDHRTDLFSFGVVLYEMIMGERPFTGASAMAVCDAILQEQPRGFGDKSLPGKLKAIICKLLEKDSSNRYGGAGEVQQELKELEASLEPKIPARRLKNTRMALITITVLMVILAGWAWRRWSRERWALETAPREIARLIDSGEYPKAAGLAQQARGVLPKDPTLEKLWMRATGEVSIITVPTGAEVSIRPYHGSPNSWETLGKTPLQKIRVPRQAYLWRFLKPGFAPDFFIGEPTGVPPPGFHPQPYPTFKLRSEQSVPNDMVVVAGGPIGLTYPLGDAPIVRVDDFLIDRHEVTNEQYKEFVVAGGYRRREFWKQPFVINGREISWDDAIASFHDATGDPGPSTWVKGDYPRGHEKYPVAGVGWYEAAAYAQFAGKSLPTAYHWMLASQSAVYTPLITPGSNFRHDGTQPVGSETALSGFGTTDMAGNVKEWCINEARDGKRLILGGGVGEPDYMFNFTDAQSPWDRRANFGFRCVRLDAPASRAAAGRIEVKTHDYWNERPVSDDVFKAYTELYAYDRGELNAKVEETTAMQGWSRTKVSFDAAYSNERVTAYLYLPNNSSPPFQTIVYFPGGFAFLDDKLDFSGLEENRGFLLISGHAVLVPVYKGMYERRDGYVPGGSPLAFQRDHAIAWAKDFSRSLDYLETRNDIDHAKIAYLGDSAGAAQGAILLAVEKRIKAAILASGGFHSRHLLPEADAINFITHVTAPVLMLNGRYDGSFPLESSQRPFFHLLGTPPAHKRHVIYDGGHSAFLRPEAVRECLDWLDKYLGPVRR